MAIYLQLGAGVGDLDYSADYRDGFSRFVKNLNLRITDKVIVVEANPFNIERLKESWSRFPEVSVLNLAVIPNGTTSSSEVDLYYVSQDAPFFQIASLDKSHVQKHFPDSDILSMPVKVFEISHLLNSYCGLERIELLALDIEGLDLRVIQSLDFEKHDIHKISFERTHAGQLSRDVSKKLRSFGYVRAGSGMDPHNSDVLWVKPRGYQERFSCFVKNFRHSMWEVQIPLRHKLKSQFQRQL